MKSFSLFFAGFCAGFLLTIVGLGFYSRMYVWVDKDIVKDTQGIYYTLTPTEYEYSPHGSNWVFRIDKEGKVTREVVLGEK